MLKTELRELSYMELKEYIERAKDSNNPSNQITAMRAVEICNSFEKVINFYFYFYFRFAFNNPYKMFKEEKECILRLRNGN